MCAADHAFPLSSDRTGVSFSRDPCEHDVCRLDAFVDTYPSQHALHKCGFRWYLYYLAIYKLTWARDDPACRPPGDDGRHRIDIVQVRHEARSIVETSALGLMLPGAGDGRWLWWPLRPFRWLLVPDGLLGWTQCWDWHWRINHAVWGRHVVPVMGEECLRVYLETPQAWSQGIGHVLWLTLLDALPHGPLLYGHRSGASGPCGGGGPMQPWRLGDGRGKTIAYAASEITDGGKHDHDGAYPYPLVHRAPCTGREDLVAAGSALQFGHPRDWTSRESKSGPVVHSVLVPPTGDDGEGGGGRKCVKMLPAVNHDDTIILLGQQNDDVVVIEGSAAKN